MEVATAPNNDLRNLKKARHELLISNEFPPLDQIDFTAGQSNFYNTIEIPPASELGIWPDLTTYYAPPNNDDEGRETDDSKENLSSSSSYTTGACVERPMLVYEDQDLVGGEGQEARSHLKNLSQSELKWRETLDHLVNHYSPGTVLDEVQQMEQRITDDITDIDKLLETSVLEVGDLFSALSLKGRYANMLHHCEIIEQEELFHLDEGNGPEDLVSLDWVDQPLAKSFKNKNRARATNKKKKGHCTMTAELVCAPGSSFKATSPVTAYFYQVEDDDVSIKPTRASKKRAAATPVASIRSEELSDVQIQNNVEKLNKDNFVTFDFRFPAGTRNKPCNIRLHVKGIVTLPNGSKSKTVEIVSQPTNRFIITTNECQFETAELKLLMMDMFSSGATSKYPWSGFVNALNLRWMRATRQEAESGISVASDRRVLSVDDYRFVSSFFANAPNYVTRDEVVKFYSFFGKATHHYRHNLAFRQLMMEGIVWGFLSKSQSVSQLEPHPVGSFIIRVSESSPGSFCISWKSDEHTVRHALLDAKILAPPASRLAEFLCGKSFLKALLQPFEYTGALRVMKPTLRRKEDAFKHYLEFTPPVFVKKEGDSGYADLNTLQ